jgi:hypothetical protein
MDTRDLLIIGAVGAVGLFWLVHFALVARRWGLLIGWREWAARREEAFWRWLAWRLPRPLVLWAAVRLIAQATMDQYSDTVVPELKAMDALERWQR